MGARQLLPGWQEHADGYEGVTLAKGCCGGCLQGSSLCCRDDGGPEPAAALRKVHPASASAVILAHPLPHGIHILERFRARDVTTIPQVRVMSALMRTLASLVLGRTAPMDIHKLHSGFMTSRFFHFTVYTHYASPQWVMLPSTDIERAFDDNVK